MPRIPDYKEPTSSDFPEADDWIWRILKSVNEQLDRITQALQKRLTQEENLNCDLRELSLKSGEEISIKPNRIEGKPTSVEVLHTDPRLFHRESSQVLSEEDVRLTVYFSQTFDFATLYTDPVLTRIRVWGS